MNTLDVDTCRLDELRKFVRSINMDAECFECGGRYQITDNRTAVDLGEGLSELAAWLDTAKRLGYES